MKKVLLLGPSLEGFSGGIQTHARNFLNVFQSHEDVAITYFPITLGLYNNEPWPKKIQRNFLLYVPFIRQALKHDIVHLNPTFDNRSILRDTAFAFLAKVFLRKKVICQFHGGRAHRVGVLNNRIFFSMIKFVFSRIDLFLILSGEQGSLFAEYFPSATYQIVPNYIDVSNVPDALTRMEDDQSVVFLFIARIDYDKGIREILKAAKIMTEKNYTFRINFCGNGPAKEWLIEEIVAQNLDASVTYQGVVSGDKKDEMFRSADVILLPSRHEAFPYTILEGFSYSHPVISSPTGAIPDIISPGNDGFLVDSTDYKTLAEKMIFFCDNKNELFKMSKNARLKVLDNYSFKKMEDVFGSLYSRV